MSKKTNNQVIIKEFNLNDIKPNSKLVIIGKPGSGKSTLIKDMLKSFRHLFPVAKIFSGTEDNNHFYSGIYPDHFIFSEYTEEEIEKFIERQKKCIGEKVANPKCVLTIDDCSDDPKFFKRPLFQKIYKNGRHWEMLFILALQYGLDIPPVIRTNIDYTFIFREPQEKIRKSLYENYASMVGSYSDFCDIMDQITEEYTALVINNRVQSNNISDCVFYYKAREHGEFKMGCDEFHQWAEQRYNKDYKPF